MQCDGFLQEWDISRALTTKIPQSCTKRDSHWVHYTGEKRQHKMSYSKFNLLAHGRGGNILKSIIFKLMSRLDIMRNSYEFALRWMTQYLTMIIQHCFRCHQATRHYPSQCWPWSMSSYDVIRPQWVKTVLVAKFVWMKANSIRYQNLICYQKIILLLLKGQNYAISLTLCMLNFSEETKKYIYNSYHSSKMT